MDFYVFIGNLKVQMYIEYACCTKLHEMLKKKIACLLHLINDTNSCLDSVLSLIFTKV